MKTKQSKTKGTYLKLQFHGGHSLSRRDLGEFLDVSVQVSGWDFCVPTCCSFQQGLMDEYVLILCLHHIVPLSSHAGHMTVNVHQFLVFHPLQHGLDHNEAACPAHTSTERAQRENMVACHLLHIGIPICCCFGNNCSFLGPYSNNINIQ